MITLIRIENLEKTLGLFRTHSRGLIISNIDNKYLVTEVTRLEFSNLKQVLKIVEANQSLKDKIKREVGLYEISFIGRCENKNYRKVVAELDALIKSLKNKMILVNLSTNNKLNSYISGYCKNNNIRVRWFNEQMTSTGLSPESNYKRFMELSDYVFIVEGKYQNYDKYRFMADFATNYKILKLD